MKQAFRLALCTLAVLCAWLWVMLSICKPNQPAAPCYSPDYVESYTVGSFDRLQIQKIYCLTGNDAPSRISTEDFQQYGRNFSMIELKKESAGGQDIYTAIFLETDPPPARWKK
ncbi:MAG: hypothetical protein ACOX81_05505 [Candidatus Heteroscillospira sp.]|jgi:hypothetical protein